MNTPNELGHLVEWNDWVKGVMLFIQFSVSQDVWSECESMWMWIPSTVYSVQFLLHPFSSKHIMESLWTLLSSISITLYPFFCLSVLTHKHKHKNADVWAEEPYQGHTLISRPHDSPWTLGAACVPLRPIIMHWAEPLSHDPPLISRIPELKQAFIQSTAGRKHIMPFIPELVAF